jgi:hypothetical protein
MSVVGPSRQFARRTDMSEVGGRPEVIGRAIASTRYTTEAIAERRAFAALLRDMRDLAEQVDDGERT